MSVGGERYEPEHGTEARYNRGCKCARCKAARANKVRERKAAKKAAPDASVTQIGAAPSAPPEVRGGPVEQATRRAVAQVGELDAWKAPLAEAAYAAARKVDDGSATAPLYQQLRDLLEIVRGKESRGSGLAGLAAIGGSRGRVGA